MDLLLKVILLGVIEGLTEFLPVSSTGHLILANTYLDFTGEFANAFAVIIQIGAILSVLLYFREKMLPDSWDRKGLGHYVTFWSKVVVGVIPAAILGLTLEETIDALLFHPVPVAIALIVGAILLIIVENRRGPVSIHEDDQITYRLAFYVGLFQCLALIPGMSRSASTIIGGLILGFRRDVAAEFSFFLAIPTLIGAGILKLYKYGFDYTPLEWQLLGVGTLVSFLSAYLVIALFMAYIKKHDFKPFAYYRIALGILVLFLLR